MRPGNEILIQDIENRLLDFHQSVRKIPGIRAAANRQCLAYQIIDSIRRVQYVTTIRDRQVTQSITNPAITSFNPLKAAVWHRANGNVDEAFWLVFLATHFGRNKFTGWELVRNVYGRLNNGALWTWDEVIHNQMEFDTWISNNATDLKSLGKFSNHRKYESLEMTGKVATSYIQWVGEDLSHQQKIESQIAEDPTDVNALFNSLYHSMDSVFRFGRTAKFDYLCMIGKLGLADIEPGMTYMSGATGPIDGARLLFKKPALTPKELELYLKELHDHLGLSFGMQVLEDSLCNWQKNPSNYKYFRG
jgi:hypothetical protein